MSHFKRNNTQILRLLLASVLLLLIVVSCQQVQEQTVQPAAVVDIIPTPTALVALPPTGGEVIAATPVTELPTPIMVVTATPIAELSSSSGSSYTVEDGDECVQGYWTILPESMQKYAGLTISGSGLVDLAPSAVSGSNSILITYDQIYVVAENWKVDLSANNSTINVIMNGTVSAKYQATDTHLKIKAIVYDLSGTLIEPARTSTLDLNGLFNLARYLGFGLDYSKPPITEKVKYTCIDDQLLLDMNEHASLTLTRTEP